MFAHRPMTDDERADLAKALDDLVTPCQHHESLGYIAWHAKAERLHKAGVKQTLCETCGLWKFPDERCDRFKAASPELLAEMRRSGAIA